MNTMIAEIRSLRLMEIATYLTKRETIVFIISRLFFVLFLYSAGDKLYDLGKFRTQLGQSPLLTSFASSVAWTIPIVEVTIAILVIIHRTTLVGLFASLNLMVMFTTYIIMIMNYSEYVPCSCNGILEGATWAQHLVFNIIFVLFGIVGIIYKNKIEQKSKLI